MEIRCRRVVAEANNVRAHRDDASARSVPYFLTMQMVWFPFGELCSRNCSKHSESGPQMASVVEHRMAQRTPAMARLATQYPRTSRDWLVELIKAMEDVTASPHACQLPVILAFRHRLEMQAPSEPESEKRYGWAAIQFIGLIDAANSDNTFRGRPSWAMPH
jgi:hypothetical protein